MKRAPSARPTLQRRSLSAGEIHVWHSSLDLPAAELDAFEDILGSDELTRASRFHREADRARFIACRGTLRVILSSYLEDSPAALHFSYGTAGKPLLRNTSGVHPLHFNVSHSQGVAAFAIARDREVGIDIERFQPNFAWEEVAAVFFSPHERNRLEAQPIEDQYQAFLDVWTAKEACAKACGEGLSLPFWQLGFSPAQNGLWTFNPTQEAGERPLWTVQSFTPQVGYTGALAAKGTGWQMSSAPWPM